MSSDIAENEYLSRDDYTTIQQTLNLHNELHEEKGHIPERNDTYAHLSGEEGWEIEVTHSSHESIVSLVPNELDNTQLENELENATHGADIDVEFKRRGVKVITYKYDHS